MFRVNNIFASVGDKEILKGVSLEIKPGETLALMGPNGSGKSTLARVVMGDPELHVTQGEVIFDGVNVLDLSPDERAKLGIFMAFQYPQEIHGVNMRHFLKLAYEARFNTEVDPVEFREILNNKLKMLNLSTEFVQRSLNVGFSGGEKKKSEILQLLLLKPKLAILDETDSGLDIDSLRTVAEGIKLAKQANPEMSTMIITHYERILEHLQPDTVVILKDGRVAKSGGPQLVQSILEGGYAAIFNQQQASPV